MENEEQIPPGAEEVIGDEDVAGVQVANAVVGAGDGNRSKKKVSMFSGYSQFWV